MSKLSYPQRIMFNTYLDCKKRTKKKIGFRNESQCYSDDEKLVRFLLANSSVIKKTGELSYSQVYDSINVICKQLCPGQWCTRSHCKNYNSHKAYYCNKTRPAVCKEYKVYMEKKKLREELSCNSK